MTGWEVETTSFTEQRRLQLGEFTVELFAINGKDGGTTYYGRIRVGNPVNYTVRGHSGSFASWEEAQEWALSTFMEVLDAARDAFVDYLLSGNTKGLSCPDGDGLVQPHSSKGDVPCHDDNGQLQKLSE